MRKILFAAAAASMFALPAFAQLVPPPSGAGSHGSARAGVSAGGMSSSAGASANAGTGDDGTSTLGLGGLLKQTQAESSPTPPQEGAGPMGTMDTLDTPPVQKHKKKLERARSHGH
ncbi:MAG TPA: hypothetical protein VGU03_10055 [Frateuria sp.]|uniref:hypothetical protein n=1 Tax=Frateuria sp. TaxID=2211372 RepID=UPI002DEB52F2|nr:hypothetical protein [Frateuria sp.]